LLALVAATARGQEPLKSNIGIAAVGALGVHGGPVSMERDVSGFEAGAFLDLGWFRTPRLRVQAEVAFLHGTLTETVVVEDSTYRGPLYDLSGAVSFTLLPAGPRSRLAPYLVAGVAVHALSSTFGTLVLDQRYNANPFGIHGGAGLRLRLTPEGRVGLWAEWRGTVAENVNRTTVRGGLMVLFNDLAAR
jgi:hypothetical protein